MLIKTFLPSLFCSLLLLVLITTAVSIGSWDLIQEAEAQLDSKSQSTAEAAIKKTADALAAVGLKGTPSNLIDTGQGFAKIFRDANGAIAFVIFWTPSTGAHAVSGPIMQTYKSEGWHLSELGYPTSDEKDLAGVTNGRFNEFQKGVIAMIKGKDAQVFTTVQDAVAKLGQPIKSPTMAEAEIKKTADALAAAGLKGTPSNLIDTGQGFAKIFRDANGAIAFVIFWTPSTGAHAVSGAIMQTYKSEGWHLSDLGYPTSDEKDLAGVTNGRFNEFQKGVIAMIKGKNAQVFTTVQDAVAKLKVTGIAEAQIVGGLGGLTFSTPPDYKVRVQFNSITVHIDRDDDRGFGSNSGEYSIRAVVNGMYVNLDKASRGQLRDVDSSETVYFVPYLATTTIAIPSGMPLSIYTLAYEEDCSRGGFGDVVTEPAILPILKGPKSEWKNEIRRIIDGALGQVTSSCNNKLGFINEIYEYPNLGAGEHSIRSNHGYYPDNPNAPGEYTLRYTISVERIEKQPSANAQQFIPQN